MSSRTSSCLLSSLTFRFHRRLRPLSRSSFLSSSPRSFISRACCARKRACCTYSDRVMVAVGRAKKAKMRSAGREDSPMPPKMRNVHHPTAENRATAYSGSVVLIFHVSSSRVPLFASHWRPHAQMQTHSVGGGAHLMSGKGEGRGV